MNAPLPVQWIDPHQAAREEEMARASALLQGYTGTLLNQAPIERVVIADTASVSENIGRYDQR
jgi:hypothetical protein